MNSDEKKFDEALGESAKVLIDEDAEYASNLDTSDITIPENTLRRVRKSMAMEEKGASRYHTPTWLKRTVAAVFCFCILTVAACMAFPNVRATLFRILINDKGNHADVFYNSEKDVPKFLEDYREPTVYPSDAERRVIMEGRNMYIVGYYKDGERVLVCQQMIIAKNPAKLNNEHCKISDTKVNGFDAKLFEYDDGTKTLTWHDDSYAYIIYCHSSILDAKYVITVAESIE